MIYRKHIQREYLAAYRRETMAERRVDIIVSSILGTIAILAFTLAVLSKIGAI